MSTTTQAITKVETKIVNKQDFKEIQAPVFLLYAEYLGYVSPLIEWAEEWCYDPKKFENWKKNIVICDAKHIFKKVKEEYSLSEIKDWYDEFYDAVFKFYEECLNSED